MMTPEGMNAMVAVLMRRGLGRERAAFYARLIGDTIEKDDAGKWVVRDEAGAVIDRIDPIEEN